MSVENVLTKSDGFHATVPVNLGDRSYNIEIGLNLLAHAADWIIKAAGRRKSVIVTDANVAALHLEAVENSLQQAGIHAGSIILEPGEATKSFDQLAALSGQLLSLEIERGDLVIALGGGVIGDLAGFAASILRRGVRLIQLPTTLLAQVDSSVGGKTGINMPHGKNLIGSFYQPELVLADLASLNTLDERQFRAGYAEVVKYGLIDDIGFFNWLDKNRQIIQDGDVEARLHAVKTSCIAKANIVAEDEREGGRRALLNLGHTFGHALEAWAGYGGKLIHGEAVAIGMTLAHEFSNHQGLCPADDVARVANHLAEAGLPTAIAELPGNERPDTQQLLDLMYQDKKVSAGRLVFILTRGIGKAFISSEVEIEPLRNFLIQKCGNI